MKSVRVNDWLLLEGYRGERSVIVRQDDVRLIEIYSDGHKPAGLIEGCVGVMRCAHDGGNGVALFGDQLKELLYFLGIEAVLELTECLT